MKKVKILLPILLMAGLLLCATPVLASDPPDGLDVDIDVVGDDADVDVSIEGDNSDVTINGEVPFITYHTSRTSKWAKNQIKTVIYPWMAETEYLVTLTADGLAGAILLANSNKSGLMTNDFLLESYDDRLTRLKTEVNSLDSESEDLALRINALEVESRVLDDFLEYQTAYYNYQTAQSNQTTFYNRALIIIGSLGATAFGFLMRAKARRR